MALEIDTKHNGVTSLDMKKGLWNLKSCYSTKKGQALINWFWSYLSDRKSQPFIDGDLSDSSSAMWYVVFHRALA